MKTLSQLKKKSPNFPFKCIIKASQDLLRKSWGFLKQILGVKCVSQKSPLFKENEFWLERKLKRCDSRHFEAESGRAEAAQLSDFQLWSSVQRQASAAQQSNGVYIEIQN